LGEWGELDEWGDAEMVHRHVLTQAKLKRIGLFDSDIDIYVNFFIKMHSGIVA